jgi:hypothetical protein
VQETNLIAAGLGVLAWQQHDQYEEAIFEKEKAKNTMVEKWLGSTKLNTLLRLLQLNSEQYMVTSLPYKRMAEAPKLEKLGVLEAVIDEEQLDQGNWYTKP